MTRPDDLRPDLLWTRTDTPTSTSATATLNPERHTQPCRVYWGTHGCDRPRGLVRYSPPSLYVDALADALALAALDQEPATP